LKHRASGITIAEFANGLPSELSRDAVGLWEIVRSARYGFGLDNESAQGFAEFCIARLLASGAVPLFGSRTEGWVAATEYGADVDSICSRVVSKWKAARVDPTPDDSIWFGLPELFLEEK
jgi:hypothetical protein